MSSFFINCDTHIRYNSTAFSNIILIVSVIIKLPIMVVDNGIIKNYLDIKIDSRI